MDLADPEPLSAFLARPEGLRLVAHPSGVPFESWPVVASGSPVRLVVGPEGGLTDEEVETARSLGWTPVRLAGPILRVETAALAGAASILARAQPVH